MVEFLRAAGDGEETRSAEQRAWSSSSLDSWRGLRDWRLDTWNTDKRDRTIDKADRRVEQAVGDPTSDKDLKVERQDHEAEGRVEDALGQLRRKAGTVIENIGRAVKQ